MHFSLNALALACLATSAVASAVPASGSAELAARNLVAVIVDTDAGYAKLSHMDKCEKKECVDFCHDIGYKDGRCDKEGECQCKAEAQGGSRNSESTQVHFKSSARGNRVASCDDKVCHRDCYQHGGFTGGSCSKDGECKCEERLPPDDGGDFDRDQVPVTELGLYPSECETYLE